MKLCDVIVCHLYCFSYNFSDIWSGMKSTGDSLFKIVVSESILTHNGGNLCSPSVSTIVYSVANVG